MLHAKELLLNLLYEQKTKRPTLGAIAFYLELILSARNLVRNDSIWHIFDRD